MGDQVVADGLQGRGIIIARKGRRLTIQFRNGLTLSRDQMFVHPIASYYKSRYGSMAAGGAGSGCNPEVGKCGRPPIGETKQNITKVGIEKADSIDVQELARNWYGLGKSQAAKDASRMAELMTEHPSYDTYLARSANGARVLGAIQLSNTKGSGSIWVEYLATHPRVIDKEIQAKGIGTQLMIEAAYVAAQKGSGLKLVALEEKGYKASPFYEKLGMHRKGTEDPIYSWSKDEAKAFAAQRMGLGMMHSMSNEEIAKRIRAAIAEEENTAPLACRKKRQMSAGGPGSGCKGQNCGRPKAAELTKDTPSDTGYLYHATNEERAQDIAKDKLRTHKPWERTDQSSWPDGSTEKRSYFSKDAGVTWQFSPEEGKPVVLRVKDTAGEFNRESTGDIYTKKPIDSSKLEMLSEDGKWYPLKNFFEKDLEADAGGEPDVGNYSHSHMEPGVFIYQPPSLRNKRRVPTDDPMEKDDKYLDVTKRKAKDTQRQRDELLKHDAPAGNPPLIPARTTLLAPHMGIYQPLLASRVIQRPARVIGAKATKISYQGRK